MEMNNQPLVSVPVITYNSAKFVLETLESIKAQTYQNIELIISDDCSTDNTVELCQNWVEQNKERFVRTEIIISDINTGVSANLNRAEKVCCGDWVKCFSGDDLLLPDCIELYINFVINHPNAYFIFSRYLVFGVEQNECNKINSNIDYSFFQLSNEEQLKHLLFNKNSICAITFFYNRLHSQILGIENDERIPMIEDYPRWINILRKNESIHFLDRITVLYRIGHGLSTVKRVSLKYYESFRLMHYYYLYPEWCKRGVDFAIQQSVNEEVLMYKQLLELEEKGEVGIIAERDELLMQNKYLQEQLQQRQNSFSYRFGRFLLHPLTTIFSKR